MVTTRLKTLKALCLHRDIRARARSGVCQKPFIPFSRAFFPSDLHISAEGTRGLRLSQAPVHHGARVGACGGGRSCAPCTHPALQCLECSDYVAIMKHAPFPKTAAPAYHREPLTHRDKE